MKYFIVEGNTESGKYNAGSKARNDAESILKKKGFNSLNVKTKYGVRYKKWQKPLQYMTYLFNYFKWIFLISKLQSEDIVVIQYPLLNITVLFDKIMRKMSKKKIKTVALIHDLDSLRLRNNGHMNLFDKRRIYEDIKVLPKFSNIISHNEKMTEKLNEYGISNDKIENLEIFDYLVNKDLNLKKRNKELPVIIAGNLSSEKAGYIRDLSKITDVEFNLYGKGLDFETTKNVIYKGSFLPDELPNELDGAFGLVWDGNDINECNGVYGEYLKYNNPHKVSLYLISNLPVIVWQKSAMADFVIKNKIGIVVNSLEDIQKIKDNLSEKEYEDIIKNVKIISNKLLEGNYLGSVVDKIGGEN